MQEENIKTPSVFAAIAALLPVFFSLAATWEIFHDRLLEGLLLMVVALICTALDTKREVTEIKSILQNGGIVVAVKIPANNQPQE